jgi:hypothetical protein
MCLLKFFINVYAHFHVHVPVPVYFIVQVKVHVHFHVHVPVSVHVMCSCLRLCSCSTEQEHGHEHGLEHERGYVHGCGEIHIICTADEVTLSVDIEYEESMRRLLAANILYLRNEPTFCLLKVSFQAIIQ